jgi:hypothetical protein
MNGGIKRVLVTVKAYPNPSKKYEETVCVAGIDLETGKWIRLYPIPYRDLDNEKKFKKYDIIEVRANKAKDDKRPESYKVDADSIKVTGHLDTKDNWNRRKEIVIPTVDNSFCEILRKSSSEDKSLGMFKPVGIEFECSKAQIKNQEDRDACYAQLSFLNSQKDTIEQIPHNFHYIFKCANEPACPGHKLPIIDWELGQSYRSWKYRYKTEALLLDKIREKWLGMICSEEKDIYFYVGNTKRFRDQFMILGAFYPPK